MPKVRLFIISACLFGCMIKLASSQAQTPGTENLQAISEKIIQGRSTNLRALKEYSWNQRTEIVKDGEVMSTKLELVRYDSSGYEQRSTLDQKLPEQKKRIAGRVQKKKMGEMKEWGEGIKSLLMQYTLPDLASLNNFLSKARIESTEESGQMILNSNNVVQPGDRMKMYVNKKDNKIQKAEVFTSQGNDPVYLEITHGQLPEGITYTKEMKLNISSKGLQLKVENFNYNRN